MKWPAPISYQMELPQRKVHQVTFTKNPARLIIYLQPLDFQQKQIKNFVILSNNLNRYVFLILDKVHIKNDLVYDRHLGSLIGFFNLWNTNNKHIELENALSGDMSNNLQTQCWCQRYEACFKSSCTVCLHNSSGNLMLDLTWEGILGLIPCFRNNL